MDALLQVRSLSGGYGALQVLWDLSFDVYRNETLVLLGPNGAGKTTLLKTILGLLPGRGGTITFDGRSIERLRTHEKIRLGISYMTEMGVFANLSVEENLLLGGFHQEHEAVAARSEEFLRLFPALKLHRRDRAGVLSGGQRKMLGVAKALMSRPILVVMDEPSSGLAPVLVGEVVDMLRRYRAEGASFLIAEQNVKFLEIADRVGIIDGGRITFSGTVAELKGTPAINEAYFGLRGR